MSEVDQIFQQMPSRYNPGKVSATRVYYFSIGDVKKTVTVTPAACTVQDGKAVENADVVLKTTPKLFVNMVLKGKMPGPIDIARGKIKTNDPAALAELKDLFRLS
ncbi:MAG: hypothetical protein H6739_38370 [Alphaproteobacteria bacterium]|nr:hypothetical protein [Alphaproteobacteria bacterium]